MIAIVDYDAGNLTSVEAAVSALGFDGKVTADPALVAAADRIIFPGVGAAGSAMANLRRLQLPAVLRAALQAGKPFLGICLGYQILFEHSDEDGGVDLLGILPGTVVRFAQDLCDETDGRPLKIPQMGWNRAVPTRPHPIWADVPEEAEFYFVHSYYPLPAEQNVCSQTRYGIEFASGVARDNLVAFQFHPEKSGRPGLKLLDNFCRWEP